MASYSSLSRVMAEHNDLLVVRTFLNLNIKSLLYYQAELAHLERELQEIESEDQRCNTPPRKEYAASWKTMSTGPNSPSLSNSTSSARTIRDALQWEVFGRIRATLREYNEALIHFAQVRSMLQEASPQRVKGLRKWLERPEYGKSFLRGNVESVWDAEKGFSDFVSFLESEKTSDGFTSHVASLILHIKRSWTREGKSADHVYTVSEATQQRIANGLLTVISSVCPVLPIVILFFIKQLLVRLGLILIFTAILASTLVFGMRIEPDKTLAITTAFAAIQVVFVGSTSKG